MSSNATTSKPTKSMKRQACDIHYWGLRTPLLKVDSDRIPECMEYCREHALAGVMLSPYSGYRLPDVTFLKAYPFITGVVLPAASRIDISGLRELPDLKLLSISDNKQLIDLAMFRTLEEFSGDWHPKMLMPDPWNSLRVLHIWRYRPRSKTLQELPSLPLLKDLAVVQSPITAIDGICRYRTLKRLELAYLPKLESLQPLTGFHGGQLELLECLKCKRLVDYKAVGRITSLKSVRLNHCGEIPDLRFLKDLSELEDFRFVGTTVGDGNLSPLLELPSLKSVGFSSRQQYSHTEKEIQEGLRLT